MSLEKFSKQLQRELKRNPKQAGILALLGGVAVWFWLPLIVGGDDDVSPVVSTPAPTPTSSAAPIAISSTHSSTVATTATKLAKTPSWSEVLSLIENDPTMQPITAVAPTMLDRSPFAAFQQLEAAEMAKVQEAVEEEEKAKEPVVFVEPTVTPDQAGLAVSSTIAAKRGGVATINGEPFRMGDSVTGKDGVTFALVGIEPGGVVLERKGERFKLTIQRSSLGGRVKLSGSQ